MSSQITTFIMGLRSLSIDNEKNRRYLSLFQSGDEHALTYFYQKSFSSLFWVGKELISDEFLVSCILQECYLKVWLHRKKIESLPHAYRFIRMNLRWQVLKQIQSTPYQVYRQTVYIDHFEKHSVRSKTWTRARMKQNKSRWMNWAK